jgi:Cu+-exporting ATPase
MERLPVSDYKEIPGQGIVARIGKHQLRVGSGKFVFNHFDRAINSTQVYVVIDDMYLGYFIFSHHYRNGMDEVSELEKQYQLYLLSGDHDHERPELLRFFPDAGKMRFKQSPQDKLDFIQSLQQNNAKVMMVGDGLNDSGALKQSDLGIAVTDDVNNFSPGSDAILDGSSFGRLPTFLKFSKDTVKIIHFSFLISLTYNLTGLSYAVTGNLSPLTAAILMPLSTVTIISFTSIATHMAGKKRKLI